MASDAFAKHFVEEQELGARRIMPAKRLREPIGWSGWCVSSNFGWLSLVACARMGSRSISMSRSIKVHPQRPRQDVGQAFT